MNDVATLHCTESELAYNLAELQLTAIIELGANTAVPLTAWPVSRVKNSTIRLARTSRAFQDAIDAELERAMREHCDYGCHEFLTDDELCTDCQVDREQRRANHAAFEAEQAYDRGHEPSQQEPVCRYCRRGNDVCSCD